METVSQNPQIIQPWKVKNVYKIVTDGISQELETGNIPWRKPATGKNDSELSLPYNPVTSNYYQKINIILLWCSAAKNDYSSNEWAGLKQWNTKKENIRRNEKGTLITYFDAMYKEVNGQVLKTPFLNYTYVFNRCQLASFDPEVKQPIKSTPPILERIGKVDEFIANTGAVIQQHNGDAYYIPASDKILLPYNEVSSDVEAFNNQSNFYQGLFSKLIQWTGAKHRLNRFAGLTKGDHAHVTEELTAEFGAAFLCAEFGITTLGKSDIASIDNWFNVLESNKQCLFMASSEASKACDYLYKL